MPYPIIPCVRARIAVRRLLPTLLVFSFLNLAAASASAADAGLTLAQAQQRALARSSQLAARDLVAASSREQAVAAVQLPDPVVKIGIDNLPVSGADRLSLGNDFMTMRRIGVMQELVSADKRRFRAEGHERSADKALAEKAVAIAAIERDTALAWLDRHYFEAMATVIAEQATQAQLEIDAAEGAYRAGRGTQADVFAARSAQVMVADRASDIQRRLANARTMLARWIGDGAALALAPPPATDTIRLDPATLETQLAHHPQLAVQRRQEEIAEAEAKLAAASRTSDWSVEVAFQQRGAAYSNMLSIGVSVPLQWDRARRQDRELASKLALVDAARAESDDMLRVHVAETRNLIADWNTARARHRRYRDELLPLAAQRIDAALGAYRGGKSSLGVLLAARGNEIDVRLQALQLQMEADRLWAQLNFLVADDRLPGMDMTRKVK